MARDRAPIGKQSRREGYALHPKAHKILAKRPNIPGQHGPKRRSKPSQYSIQLREKQKIRRLYGLLEKQFSNLVREADRTVGQTGNTVLEYLERRIDNVVYRSGFAASRRAARQLVSHGHFILNGRRVDIPSIRLKAGDEITVRPKSANNAYMNNLEDLTGGLGKSNYSWFSVDSKKQTIKINALPTREDAEQDLNEQLVVEYYSR
ncbi:MAG TPA: 30S ribosomal protein S4 [Candidatus Saccharibacteria bacterium]|jgi:small subunit ribosomal protein S4|nr:30S ribosomal protein S4 [Candidatus Saccharibacteria bacterium]